nr:hypothetical protein [Tanacetum cinerariifolium]
DDVPVVPEPVLVDENEDPEEDKFEEEEDPQEEEDDMEIDIEENENEPEITYFYVEMDPLNHLLLSLNLMMRSRTVIVYCESSTAPFLHDDSDDLLSGLIMRDINSLFSQMASLLRRMCGRETAHALVEKKGKAKDEFYGKLILDLGNVVRFSMEQGTAAMKKLFENLGNAEDKVECKKLNKELEEAEIMPPKSAPLNQVAILRMINDNVDDAIVVERARQENVRNDASGTGPARGHDATPAARECTFSRFMKCNPTAFCSTKGAAELMRWFNELALMCLRMVEPERVKVDAYIWGLTDNIKGEVTSTRLANLSEAVRMAHKLMDQKSQDERILKGKKQK